MASEWKNWKVKELIAAGFLDIGDGYRAKNDELGNVGLPFARAGNINGGFNFADADRFPVGNLIKVGNKVSQFADVLFTSKGTVGRFAFVERNTEQFVYSPQLCYWRSLSHTTINPRFLYYWMQSSECLDQFSYLKSQTDMADYVSLRDQREMTISLPEPSLQASIVSALGPFDFRLKLLEQANKSLEGIARAIFRSWFVDFDPVQAKAEGREPDGMDADTAALFPSQFEEGEAGLLPTGWHLRRAGDLMKQSRESINPLRHPDRLFVHYSLPAFDEGRRPKLEYGREIKSNKTVAPEGCILLSKLNPHIPRVWLPCSKIPENAVCSTEFLVFQPASRFSVEYLFCQFVEPGFAQRFGGLTTGTSNSHQRVKPEYLLEEKLIEPEPAVVEAFTSLTGPMFEKINANLEAQQTLADLRDTLLPRLISGKLRVPEAEAMLTGGCREV
jgi:type I restriction enzyme S subunit